MNIEISTKSGVVIIRVGMETITVNTKRKHGYLVAVNKDSDKGRPTRIIK